MGCASSKEDAGDGGAGHQLWNACKAGDINAIERLVAEGAKPNTYKDKVRWRRACCNSGCGCVSVPAALSAWSPAHGSMCIWPPSWVELGEV